MQASSFANGASSSHSGQLPLRQRRGGIRAAFGRGLSSSPPHPTPAVAAAAAVHPASGSADYLNGRNAYGACSSSTSSCYSSSNSGRGSAGAGAWPTPSSSGWGLTPTRRQGAGMVAAPAAAAAAASPSAPSPSAERTASVSDESKAVGCLIGAMCGNVLAAPYQDERHFHVVRYRPNGVTDFWRYDIGAHAADYGHYTGDFSNLLAVSRSLVSARGVDTSALLQALADAYEPGVRRYSPYDRVVMDAVLSGTEPLQVPELAERYLAETTRRLATTSSDRAEREPYGPTDLCAAARVAPIGFAYRSAGGDRLLAAVRRSLVFSHPTPLGLDAAHVVAAAAAWAARQQPSDGVTCRPEVLLSYLINDVAVTTDMLDKLRLIRDNLFQVDPVSNWRAFYAGPQWHALARMLSLLSFHGYPTAGSEFAAVALLVLLTSWGKPEQAVIVAASLGGHAPATTQVVGALVGALYGRDWVPERWWDALENDMEGYSGRDGVVEVAAKLSNLQLAELDS